MSSERGRYRTKQQEEVLDFLKGHRGCFMTVEQVTEALRRAGSSVGKTTVYRALDRFTDDGVLSEIPSNESDPVRFGYIEDDSGAKLVCMRCHQVQTMHCADLETFLGHVENDHGFKLDSQKTVLYGICESCEQEE